MIKISRLTDYAIVLLSQMVAGSKSVFSASDLAERSSLPLPTTSKILKKLAKNGIVSALRGAAGGYRLERPAGAISIAAIIEAMDGPISITDCADPAPKRETCRIKSICPMSANWGSVNRVVRAALEEVSLTDMLADSRGDFEDIFASAPELRKRA